MNKKMYFKVLGISTVCLMSIIVLISVITSSLGANKGIEKILDKKSAGERHNILLMGTDKDETRCDVIMLLSVSTKDNSINVMSVPRDTRVKYKSNYMKVNAVLGLGGEELEVETIKDITGAEIHDYVKVNFNAVEDVIDALGGVKFDVPQNMNYDDPYQDLHIHLEKGEQTLNGEQALQLMRFRSYPMGDLQRIQVQQDFIRETIKQKAKGKYIFKAKKLYKIAKENMVTTFTPAEVSKLAFGLIGTGREDVKSFEFPYHFSQSGIYVIPNADELEKIIEENFK